MDKEIEKRVVKLINSDHVVLFMKGNKLMPMCGFSNTAVQILNSIQIRYQTIDVLEDNTIREGIKLYSNWPTIPQLYVKGEFIGGSDIMLNLYQEGKLQEIIETIIAK
uniref:Glutaredoxin n=1 Tax=Flintiella sanguinaria TaxID=101926 RepID=A0A1X9PU45_9RHOD|nr:glutaredoxin-related protein [Flintiella sanguinaria]